MKNEQSPDDSGLPWNTDDVLFGGITCKQLSRLCTCFISALRMANMQGKEGGVRGTMALIDTLIKQQLELSHSTSLSPEEKRMIEENLEIGLQAVCLAGIFSINQIDARHLTAVGASTIQILHKLAESTGPIGPDDEVIIQIRKTEDGFEEERIEMGVRLEASSDLLEKMGDSSLAKEIKKVVTPPPEDTTNLHGLN